MLANDIHYLELTKEIHRNKLPTVVWNNYNVITCNTKYLPQQKQLYHD